MAERAGRLAGVPARGPDQREERLGPLVARTARGDEQAFEELYDLISPRVHGLVRRVVRDLAQSEEVVQEVFLEVWRSASRYQPGRGTVLGWALTLAHHRAVDRVRSAQADADRDEVTARRDQAGVSYDEVAESVEIGFEQAAVRRCLGSLTDLQRESITLAYYGGYTYREVASLLEVPLGTVKTRLRDGLIRLRDCLGVN